MRRWPLIVLTLVPRTAKVAFFDIVGGRTGLIVSFLRILVDWLGEDEGWALVGRILPARLRESAHALRRGC